MPQKIPHLQLSKGQVAWTLMLGRPPSQKLNDQLRYLRQVGVPHDEKEVGRGRGNPIYYSFEDLIECGVAVYAMDHGIKPGQIAEFLIAGRASHRKRYRQAFQMEPEDALEQEWVLSRGQRGALGGEMMLMRLGGRLSDTPGEIEINMEENDPTRGPFQVIERYADGSGSPIVILNNMVIELVAWALKAPEIRAGRPG